MAESDGKPRRRSRARPRPSTGAPSREGWVGGGGPDRLHGKRVCICLGAGGVGKTTTSAALALGLAIRGQKVAVVTIDPAARLAAAMGLREVSGDPARIEPKALAAQGIEMKGELWAMMLDSKRTFDEIVTRLAPSKLAREEI